MLHFKQALNLIVALTVMVLASLSSATPLDVTKQQGGIIHFLDDNEKERCTLPIPEVSQYFNFGANDEYCENNMVTAFWLENVPSATLINFYSSESCTDAQSKNNFYIKFKTVKNPTNWDNKGFSSSVDSLRNLKEGWLVPKKNIRIESSFIGSDFSNNSLNEHLSCVYIERSQLVN